MQKGYKATSIEEIVKATGCSAGNIYYHFKSKEGLFLFLVDEWNLEWEVTWQAKEQLYKTTSDKLYGMAEHLALDQLNHPLTRAIDEFFNDSEKASEVQEHINEMVKGYLRFNEQLLQRGVDNGEFALTDIKGLAVILDGLVYGVSQHTRKMNREETLSAYRLAMDVFLHGIAKPSR